MADHELRVTTTSTLCWSGTESRQIVVAYVHVNNGYLKHKFWIYDFLVYAVRFIDTGFCKFDRHKVQSANIAWNVLLLCLRLSHGRPTVATGRMCDRKFLRQILRHSLAKLCMKNYENYVKVTAKKSAALFMWTRCIFCYILSHFSRW